MTKKPKKLTVTYWRKKCVGLAKEEAKRRAGWICEYCGKGKKDGIQLHGSHIKHEGSFISMSADVDNILCLCATHHTGGMSWHAKNEPSWHSDPVVFGTWFNEKYPGRGDMLNKRAQRMVVVDWEKKYQKMKEGVFENQ